MKYLYQLCAAVFLGAGLLSAQPMPALNLDQLIEIGLDNNSNIRIADRNLAAARANRRGSYSGLVPSVRFWLNRDLKKADQYIQGFGYVERPKLFASGLSLSQTIFDGAISWYDARTGALSFTSSQATYEWTRQQTVLTIKQAYYSLLSALELLEVAEEALELSRRQLELVEERYRLQAIKETDLLKAKVSMGQQESRMHEARQNVTTSVTSLNVALGQDPFASLNIARDSVALAPVPDRETAWISVGANNPSLQVQSLGVEQARLNAKRQRGSLMPSIGIGYSVSSADTLLPGAFDFDLERQGVASLSLSFPIFSGLRNSSQYSRLRYLALAEEERLDDLERNLKGQLENTLSSLESLHSIHPINQEVLASAEADVRLASEQYNLGAISILDLLTTQVNLIDARSSLVRTTYDIKIAEAQLEALMGTIGQ